jgi:hypothetical protein
MTETEKTELVRVLEVDYEKTTKLIEGIVGSSFTIRGWAIALISALIGLTFQTQLWQIAAVGIIVTLLIAFIDAYHSWLYASILLHAQNVEHVLGLYYASLARGEDDPEAGREFEIALLAHQFGRFAQIQKFHLGALRDARPRLIILILYLTLLVCVVVSGTLVFVAKKNPIKQVECTAVPGATNVYVCRPK